jgi:PAS domain-containing protein
MLSQTIQPVPRGRTGITAGLANAVLAQLPLAVAVIDAASRLLYWNEPAASLLGAPPQLAADRPLLAGILAGVVALTEQQRERTLEFALIAKLVDKAPFPRLP